MFKLKGVQLKHCKNTAEMPPVRMGVPSTVIIPMSMHVGSPARPTVKAGDNVKVGQLIGEAGGGLSSPVYSSVSGTVKKIDEITLITGAHTAAVIIESDGEQTAFEGIEPPTVDSRESFLVAMAKSGIVGLGGAGFPTAVKLSADVSKIDTLVVNGAECEPYITSDTRTMLDRAEEVAEGIRLLMKYLEVKRAVVGIENNKKACIERMREALTEVAGAEVRSLPAVYPQGGEKVLVYHTVGRVIGDGKLPHDVGTVVVNCTTAAEIARYTRTGMPLTERCVTVDGSAVAEPKNVIAPIGTPVSELIAFCGGFKCEPKKVLYGGPMMGIPLSDLSAPVLKQTNAILAFNEKDAAPPKPSACIRCGRCAAQCPFGLSPCDISRAYESGDMSALEKSKVNLCMECGCCSYTCPAKRELVQKNKLAKAALRDYKNKNGGKRNG